MEKAMASQVLRQDDVREDADEVRSLGDFELAIVGGGDTTPIWPLVP